MAVLRVHASSRSSGSHGFPSLSPSRNAARRQSAGVSLWRGHQGVQVGDGGMAVRITVVVQGLLQWWSEGGSRGGGGAGCHSAVEPQDAYSCTAVDR